MRLITSTLLGIACAFVHAQSSGPEVTAWILNPGGDTGYGGILSNVEQVQYSDANVYVSCTCIPGYDIGPWAGNPNTPANQNFEFKITRTPHPNTSILINTPLGHIGVWRNGVSIFNAQDAMSYMNQNVWLQNAVVVEGPGFDLCNGHPAPNGEYHHHLNPTCLYDYMNDQMHSPIIGYAFDGYPIYGAFGFANADGTGGIARMRTSYRKRDITERTTLPNGSTASQPGPAVSDQYPVGYYVQDFEMVPGLGDLDMHNGRTCVTPEYPGGTYAYFVTIDSMFVAEYPYTLGPTYYGTVPAGNTGMGSGHNTPTEPVLTWDGSSSVLELSSSVPVEAYPNPTEGAVRLSFDASQVSITISDAMGRTAFAQQGITLNGPLTLDLSALANGTYSVLAQQGDQRWMSRITVAH